MSATNADWSVTPAPPAVDASPAPVTWRSYFRVTTVSFTMVHVAAVVGAIWFWSWGGLALALGSYFIRMVVVTAAYHRYFSHKAFKTSRPVQFILAVLAQTAGMKGVIWWASHHRWHHKYSDTPKDVHSVRQRGFWYSHVGWVLSSTWTETDPASVKDLTRFPELRFLDHENMAIVPMVLFALVFLLIGGVHSFIWGFWSPRSWCGTARFPSTRWRT